MSKTKRSALEFVIASMILSSLISCRAQDADFEADLVFHNGSVYTMDEHREWATAVAVSGNRITYVGNDEGAHSFIGASSTVVDLEGRMLMPGFVDAHNHPISGGITKVGLELTGARSTRDILERLAGYVQENQHLDRFFGYGWELSMFHGKYPTKEDLDAIVDDRPVILLNEDSHHAWANSMALRNAEIDSSTNDEVPGSVYHVRDESGEPTGLMFEAATWRPVAIGSGFFGGIDAVKNAAETFVGYLSRHGVTTIQDMGMEIPGSADPTAIYDFVFEMEQEGMLPMRVKSAVAKRSIDVSDGELRTFLQLTQKLSEKYASDRFDVNGFKVWTDGVSVAETANVLEPYESGKKPETLWTEEVTVRWLEAFHLAGVNVNFHCEGDQAVRTTLDAIEIVQSRHGRLHRRHAISHASIMHPDDIPRFTELGVTLNTTPIWFTNWKNKNYEAQVLIPMIGQKRALEHWGIQKLVADTGANVTFGADVPGSELYEQGPLYMIQAAITRKSPLLVEDPGLPPLENVFSLEQALRAYSINGAYQLGMEDDIGSIEVGKLADLIVVEKNLFEMPPADLHTTRVLLTISDGVVVHDAFFGLGDIDAGKHALDGDSQRISEIKAWLN